MKNTIIQIFALLLISSAINAEDCEALKMQIVYQNNEKVAEAIRKGLAKFNSSFLGYKPSIEFVVSLKDENGKVVGGIIAWMRTGIHLLCIDTIWTEEHLRKQGYGTKLLLAAEEEGIKHGCTHSQLETLSYQAKGFYEKLGYVEIGLVEHLYGDHDAYYMRKILGQRSH